MPYAFCDADQHYYEAEDAFTRYASRKMRDERYIRWVTEADGKRRRLMAGKREVDVIGNPTFDPTAAPGIYHETLKQIEVGQIRTAQAYGQLEPIRPEYRDREARLTMLDTENVEKTLLFPTLGVTMEGFLQDDVDMFYAAFHAFNRWLDDDWGFDWRDRIYAAPYLSLLDLDRAVTELDWVLKAGAKVITLRPGPAYGRSPADPYFDPFWARVAEARVLVTFHAFDGPSDTARAHRALWCASPKPRTPEDRLLEHAILGTAEPIMDTMLALVLHNLFGRFPNIRVASIENGAAWVPYLMYRLDHAGGLINRTISVYGETLKDRPSEIFREKVWISPFPEEDIAELSRCIGSDRILMGSDWPHAECIPHPRDYLEELDGFAPDDVHKIMRANLAGLLPQ